MNARPWVMIAALPVLLWACQGGLYPVAPDTPERVTVGSPDPGGSPGSDPAPQEGPFGGQLVASGTHFLEFLGYTPPRGSYTLYLFPWGAGQSPIPAALDATAKLKLSNGREIPMTAATNSDDGSLFFYAVPEASFASLNVTVQAEVTLGGTILTGSFSHP